MHLHQHWHPAFCISDPWILGLVGPWGNIGIISLFCCQHSSAHTPSRLTPYQPIPHYGYCTALHDTECPFTDNFLFQAYRDLARYTIPKFSVILQFISLFIHVHTPSHNTDPFHPLSSHSRISVIRILLATIYYQHELLPSTFLAGYMQLNLLKKRKRKKTSLYIPWLQSQFTDLFTYRRVRHLVMAKAFRHVHGDFQNSHFSESESQEPQLNKLLGRSASIGTDNHPITTLASPGLTFSSSVKEVSDCLLMLVSLRS